MFQPRRLRTRRPSSVETSARKPSHFSSKDHPEPEGSGPGREHRIWKPQDQNATTALSCGRAATLYR